MSKIRKALADKFPGDKDLAIFYIEEIKKITQSVNVLDIHSKENFSIEDGKSIRIALAKAIAEIVSEIEIPIVSKFPDLK
jgi:hypothetical protein